jgi:cysteine desulfuration protein SufE
MTTTNPANLIEARQQELIETFEMFSDWMEKYEHLIDLGKGLEALDEADRVEENLIKGCQSRVWLALKSNEGGRLHFTADSDAIITKGLVALTLNLLSNAPAELIATANLHSLQTIGLHEHLSPTRSNGLTSMVQQIKLAALKQC